MQNGGVPTANKEYDNISELLSPSFDTQQQQQQQKHQESASPTAVELYTVVTLLCVFVVVGSAGNAIVLWVFSRRRDKLVSTVFIVVLACVDFITCLVAIPLTIYFEMVEFRVHSNFLCKLYQFHLTSSIPFSALIMVAIAIDRYLCICHPFVHAITVRRAWITSGLLGICAAAIGICVSLMYSIGSREVSAYFENTEDYSIPEADKEDFGASAVLAWSLPALTYSTVSWIASNRHDLRLEYKAGMYQPGATARDGGFFVRNVSNDDVSSSNHSDVTAGGFCRLSNHVFSDEFMWYFQKFYNALYLACVIIVIFLYALIYRSVVARRSRRLRQKSGSFASRQPPKPQGAAVVNLMLTPLCKPCNAVPAVPIIDEADVDDGPNHDASTPAGSQKPRRAGVNVRPETITNNASEARRSHSAAETGIVEHHSGSLNGRRSTAVPTSPRERARGNNVASLRTAAMLFVVAVVFVAFFLPAFLMTTELLPYKMVVFYMYFGYNVANPFIYSFMNKNFRENLKRLFCGPKGIVRINTTNNR